MVRCTSQSVVPPPEKGDEFAVKMRYVNKKESYFSALIMVAKKNAEIIVYRLVKNHIQGLNLTGTNKYHTRI